MAGDVCMLGRIRSTEQCGSCGEGYKLLILPATGDQVDLVCNCGRRPRFYYVDARGIRDRHGAVGRLYRDPRRGTLFGSFVHAKRILEAIRLEIDEGRFDSRNWSAPAPRKEG